MGLALSKLGLEYKEVLTIQSDFAGDAELDIQVLRVHARVELSFVHYVVVHADVL